MKNLIVLPTLDGSKKAAVDRLEAWSTTTSRRRMAAAGASRAETIGERRDVLDLLGVEQ